MHSLVLARVLQESNPTAASSSSTGPRGAAADATAADDGVPAAADAADDATAAAGPLAICSGLEHCDNIWSLDMT